MTHPDTILLRNLILNPLSDRLCIVAPRMYGKTITIREVLLGEICIQHPTQQHVWMTSSASQSESLKRAYDIPYNLLVTPFYSKYILGMRVGGWCILDDCYTDEYPAPRAFQYITHTLVPVLVAGGKLLYIGSRWSRHDLIRLLKYRFVTIELPTNLPEDYLEKKREAFIGDDLTFRALFHNDSTPEEVIKYEKRG